MSKLGYDNPGSREDNVSFKKRLKLKSKSELLLILGNVADACDEGGKGYIDQWEEYIRHIIGYRFGKGTPHDKKCGCGRCMGIEE